MVSGHGVRGGRGRCYSLWRDFLVCAERHGTYGPGICQLERADYIECLHHTKLVNEPFEQMFLMVGILRSAKKQNLSLWFFSGVPNLNQL